MIKQMMRPSPPEAGEAALKGTATYRACYFHEGEPLPFDCPRECLEDNPAEDLGRSHILYYTN